jgi:hypothetical protein
MPFFALIFLILCHFISGYGVLTLFSIRQKTAVTIALSLLLGIAVASFIPFLMQLFYLSLTPVTVFFSLAITALALNIPAILHARRNGAAAIRSFRDRFSAIRTFRVPAYEIPFLLILGFLVFVSVWRCYYLPPTSRDVLSGPEAIAEYAVSEHTMINSFFNVDLFTTNNQFKSPFLISLQMIYKMAGFPFGQLWLSIVFVSFIVLLYQLLKEKLHPIIAGLLLLLLMMTPELYAYTFMVLYDYSNMVFFFLSLYFLFDYYKTSTPSQTPVTRTFYFAGLLMGIATYIRSETLVLAVFFIPVTLLMQFREKYSYRKIALTNGLFLLPSLLGYYLPVQLYIKHYLPVSYDVAGLINQHPSDLAPLFKRYGDICSRLLTGEFAVHLWGYFMFVWAAFFVGELILLRRFNKEARNWLYAIGVVFVGLGLLGYLLPLFDLVDTTKRGLFKILPLMLLYLANNEGLIRLSAWIGGWERSSPAVQQSPAGAPTQQNAGKRQLQSPSRSATSPKKKQRK